MPESLEHEWDYRIVRHGDDLVAIHEVTYIDGEEYISMPYTSLSSSDIPTLASHYQMVATAFTQPVLDLSLFDEDSDGFYHRINPLDRLARLDEELGLT
jgi:hypothetical protein